MIQSRSSIDNFIKPSEVIQEDFKIDRKQRYNQRQTVQLTYFFLKKKKIIPTNLMKKSKSFIQIKPKNLNDDLIENIDNYVEQKTSVNITLDDLDPQFQEFSETYFAKIRHNQNKIKDYIKKNQKRFMKRRVSCEFDEQYQNKKLKKAQFLFTIKDLEKMLKDSKIDFKNQNKKILDEMNSDLQILIDQRKENYQQLKQSNLFSKKNSIVYSQNLGNQWNKQNNKKQILIDFKLKNDLKQLKLAPFSGRQAQKQIQQNFIRSMTQVQLNGLKKNNQLIQQKTPNKLQYKINHKFNDLRIKSSNLILPKQNQIKQIVPQQVDFQLYYKSKKSQSVKFHDNKIQVISKQIGQQFYSYKLNKESFIN